MNKPECIRGLQKRYQPACYSGDTTVIWMTRPFNQVTL